ncbi:MAG: nicotinate (nicotinamide) nucleotide adenylyltransferase [Fimbriimonas sp.]
MKIGILGGTFDPPHRGHLQLAVASADQLMLDEVLLIPANRNPLKSKGEAGATAKQRLAMTGLLVQEDPRFAVSDLELTRGGVSFMVETLFELQMAQPAEYWLILGADSLRTFPEWKSPNRILKMCRLAAAVRLPLSVEDALNRIPDDIRPFVDPVEMVPSEISSTEVRDRLVRNKPLADVLTPNVLKYIRDNGLYRS